MLAPYTNRSWLIYVLLLFAATDTLISKRKISFLSHLNFSSIALFVIFNMFNVTTENVTWSKYHRVWITTVLKISLITYFPHHLGIIYIWMENSSIPIIQHIWIFIRQRNTVLWVFDVFISISININNEIDMSALYRFKC